MKASQIHSQSRLVRSAVIINLSVDSALGIVAILLMTLSLLALFIVGAMPLAKRVQLRGIMAAESGPANLVAQDAGVLLKLTVHEGELVTEGQVIAIISRSRYRSGISDQRLNNSLISERLALLERLSTMQVRSKDEVISGALQRMGIGEKRLASLNAQFELQRKLVGEGVTRLARFAELQRQGFSSETQVMDASEALTGKKIRLQELEKEVLEVQNSQQLLTEEVRRLRAEGSQGELRTRGEIAALRQAITTQDSADEIILVSPRTGRVHGLLRHAGQEVTSGSVVASIVAERDSFRPLFFADGDQIGLLNEGQKLIVSFPSFERGSSGKQLTQISHLDRAPTTAIQLASAGFVGVDGKGPLYRVSADARLTRVTVGQKSYEVRHGLSVRGDVYVSQRSIFGRVYDRLFGLLFDLTP